MVNSSSSLAISCATPPKTPGFGKSYKVFHSHCYYFAVRRTILTLGLLTVVLFLSLERGQTFVDTFRVFDEFGNLRSGDLAARLDNYAIHLQQEPGSYGYIVVYAPPSASKRIRQQISDYLTKTRGLRRERIKTHHAGYNDPLTQPLIRLWILPKGVGTPMSFKHDVDLAGFKGMLAEYQRSDDIKLVNPALDEDEDPEDIGAPVGDVTYAACDDVLKAQKHSIAHVIAFNGIDEVPGTWRRVAESTVADLKRFGFAASRFKIGYGGQSDKTKVQLWILPPGEMPPVKDPASEPLPVKAIQIGEYDGGMLGHPQNERVVFEGLLTVMRDSPQLRACLIVRMETAAQDPVDDAADLPKLVEKWKGDLLAKHKMRTERILILFANAREFHLPSLEVWVVPPGQLPPDLDQ